MIIKPNTTRHIIGYTHTFSICLPTTLSLINTVLYSIILLLLYTLKPNLLKHIWYSSIVQSPWLNKNKVITDKLIGTRQSLLELSVGIITNVRDNNKTLKKSASKSVHSY